MIDKIKNNERVIFTKFGDGEYLCMNYRHGMNCDNDRYTPELGTSLRKAFCILSSMENTYIGKWNDDTINSFNASLYYNYLQELNKPIQYIPFVNYHLITNDQTFNTDTSLYHFVKTIQECHRNKIIISNEKNKRLMTIFKGNEYITIPSNSWYANGYYNELYNDIVSKLSSEQDDMILISGGLASKVLIQEIASQFNKVSCIDIGSGFDILSRNVDTRGWFQFHSYHDECTYYKDLLPDNWTDYIETP